MSLSRFKFSPAFLALLPVLAVLGHAVLALTATTEKSMTSDEIAHLTAGATYNLRNDYRLQPENGNLPQRWAALPLTLASAPLPPVTLETWQHADVWRYGHSFFYEQSWPAGQYLFAGRAMIALFSAATGLLIFHWSRSLFGVRGAWLSLGLFVFSPTFLAHGALVTSDAVMAFFFLASVGAWWRHLERPGAAGAALSAVILGFAFVAKFSAVLLAPMLALLALVWLPGKVREAGWRAPLLRLLRTGFVHAITAWAIIWLCYGFRFSAFAPGLEAGASFNHGWGWILAGMGAPAQWFYFAKECHVLPESWLYGLAFVIQFSQERGAFLNGEYGLTGWVRFFPYAFLVKSTLPFLIIVAGGCLAAGRAAVQRLFQDGRAGLWQALRPAAPLAVLFGIYWFTSLTSHLNIGHRHILPTYPVLFIAAGWLGQWCDRRHRLAGGLIVALLSWHAVESWRIRPHYLAYFNPLAGGPANGWRHLVDSSLDWGQDLPGLKHWLDENNAGPSPAPVFLSYFGTGDPRHEGIQANLMPMLPIVGPDRPWHALTGGIYCVSATMLQQVYGAVRGEWTPSHEREYQQYHHTERELLAFHNDPARRAELLHEANEGQWKAAWKRYEVLRFARLCYYLRARQPDAQVGYSILIYRLSHDEVDAAVNRRYSDWLAAIEQAGAR